MAESRFLQWIRKHSLFFGISVGIGCGLLMLLLMFFDLQFVETVMGRNLEWVRLFTYTVVLFVILAMNCRPLSSAFGYWTVFVGLLLLHLACFVWFILKVRSLGALHYVVAAPLEMLLLYFLLKRGMGFSGSDQDND